MKDYRNGMRNSCPNCSAEQVGCLFLGMCSKYVNGNPGAQLALTTAFAGCLTTFSSMAVMVRKSVELDIGSMCTRFTSCSGWATSPMP